MNRLAWIASALFAMAVVNVPAQESLNDSSRDSLIDRAHMKWVDHVMRSISTIKPGMTRRDLVAVFNEEGGLSTRTQRRYVYKHCPYIKVEVNFDPVGKTDMTVENPEDRIVKISRPYLEYAIGD
jgi:hypothetical protein